MSTTIHVFDLAGVEQTVTISADAQTYLDMGLATTPAISPAADELRFLTIADYTLILNTLVTVASETSADYDITDTWRDYDVMICHTPANDTYHKTRNSTDVEVKGYYKYHLDSGSFPTWHRNAGGGGGGFGTPTWWQNIARNPMGCIFNFAVARGPWTDLSYTAINATSGYLNHASAFDNYKWRSGDEVYLSAGAGVTPGWYTVTAAGVDDILLGRNLTLTHSGGLPVAGKTLNITGDYICQRFAMNVDLQNETLNDMFDVALKLTDGLQAAGCTDGLIEWHPTGAAVGYFIITGPWRGMDMHVIAPSAPTDGAEDLVALRPFADTATTSIAGTGGPYSIADQVIAVKDRWTKVSPPNDPHAVIDETTMPVKMVRESTGDFTIDTIDWSERLSGDYATNPIPKMWGMDATASEEGQDARRLSDITLHRNRLVITAADADNVTFSQAGDFFNFFVEDAENLADSDPIDVNLSSSVDPAKVSLIDYAVPFRKTLLLLTKAGVQFELNAPETLTPSTVAISPSTQYHSLGVRPDTIGLRAYFMSAAEGITALREYYYEQSVDASDALDVSKHVERYLPTSVRRLRCAPNDDVVFVLPPDSNELYSFRSYWAGDKREQAAWSRYTLDTQEVILDDAVIDSRCYMLLRHSTDDEVSVSVSTSTSVSISTSTSTTQSGIAGCPVFATNPALFPALLTTSSMVLARQDLSYPLTWIGYWTITRSLTGTYPALNVTEHQTGGTWPDKDVYPGGLRPACLGLSCSGGVWSITFGVPGYYATYTMVAITTLPPTGVYTTTSTQNGRFPSSVTIS